ncbi:MAG TPA: aminopeptidase [Richelia sp.]|nr:aminopeptidase [Richelia sp.]
MSHSYLYTDNNQYKTFELPGAKPHYNPDCPGQVKHIFLDLDLDIPQQSLQGNCFIQLVPIRNGIDYLHLNAVNLSISSVKVDDVEHEFDYDGEEISVKLLIPTHKGQQVNIAIAYYVEKPQRGIYFIQPDENYPHKPTQVWTQGEDEDSRFWFPCFDYPGQLSASEIRVSIPKPLMAISNGELIAIKENGCNTIYHWSQKQVHPTYLMTLAVGDFAEIRDEWNGRPVTYYVEKGKEQEAQLSMGKTPRMIEFLSQKYGYTYPYPKYAQVCVNDFIFGGMENTSTTLLTDKCLLDAKAALDNRNTERLVVHELVHQWFGDLLVIKHWSHAWVKEGMATYSEILWAENEYGVEEGAYYRLKDAYSYFSEDSDRYRRPMVTHVYREAIELYDCHIYEKGACVYHMIRAELGEELFWQAIKTFVNTYIHQTVETIDLLRAIEVSTGRNLSFLFDQYVYRGGYPDFRVVYSWDGDSNLAKVTVTQVQAQPDQINSSHNYLFDLKIPIAFGYIPEGKPVYLKNFTVRIYEKEQNFYFPLVEKPQFISFDYGNNYLKTVVLEYAIPELKAQLVFDPDPISRIYAAEALGKKGGLESLKALSEALIKEPFWGVRAEVAKQMAKIKLDQVLNALTPGLKDRDARVRRAVVESLAIIKTNSSYKALKHIVKLGDESYYVESAACRAIGEIAAVATDKPKEEKVLKLLNTVLMEKSGWNELVRSGAIEGLAAFKTSEAALEIIMEYTRLGIPQSLRLGAIVALGKISIGQTSANIERILDWLTELSKETFFLTQVAVVNALGSMETPKALGILLSLANQTADGRVRRCAEEKITLVQKSIGTEKTLYQLRGELDELKQQNQSLQSRLENLEALSKRK